MAKNPVFVDISIGYDEESLEHYGYFDSVDDAIKALIRITHPELLQDWDTLIVAPGEDYPVEPYIVI